MNRPDFENIRVQLLETGDAEVVRVVRILDAVFRSPKYRPADETASQERELIAAVRAIFPTPFARKFVGWVDAEAEYREALERWADPAVDAETKDRAALATSRRFRDAFLEMWTCWLQIVHFLPFILMAALRRLDDDVLKQHAAKELAHVLHHYKTFYEKYQSERRREADQLHLLVYLNKLFRRLSSEQVLPDDFLFTPLMRVGAGQFTDIFPDRFDACMRLLLQMRNSIIHGRIENRPPEVTRLVNELAKWCFLEIIATLAPICRGFSLSYAAKLVVGPPGVDVTEVEALDFSAIDGPREARYRLTSRPQLDDYALVDQRLYLIARDRQMGIGTGQIVEPRDYLDLTPFIIIERLRERVSGPTAENRQRMLFALEQYLEPLRQLLFSELGGSSQKTLSTGGDTGGDWQTRLLLETIDRFKTRASLLTSQVSIAEGRGVTVATARSQLWLASKVHLGPLLDVRRYDEGGTLLPEVPGPVTRSAYDPELFVGPPEGAVLTAFLESDRRAVVLVGPSGAGKSSLLVHHYLACLRRGRLAAFLAGRQFDVPSFRELLVSKLATQIAGGWKSLDDLDAFLDEYGEGLTIFIDAVNEYNGSGGPLSLLGDMIGAIKAERALRRIKLVVTCRTETWDRYAQRFGGERPLDPEIFFALSGDAIRLASFDDPALRRSLFAAYQRRYRLTPDSYDALSGSVQALIAQPFLMALIAETYGDRPDGGEIPRDLDYFTLFKRMTERKQAAAQLLWPAADMLGREQLPAAMEGLCELLAEMIYRRLAEEGVLPEGEIAGDALPFDLVDKRWELQKYVRGEGPVSVLETVLQVGLLERISVPHRDRQGRLVASSALAFFHDQYTQYWLAAAYQASILGWLDPPALTDSARTEALARKIATIIARSVSAPVLAGALDHWLQKNLETFHDGHLAPVMPLFNRLAAHESSGVRYYLVAIITHLILRRFLTPEEVYGPIFQAGSPRLRREMVGAFVTYWPSLPPEAARAFIDACDPELDKDPLERLGDVFALQLRLEPAPVAAYLGAAISPLSLASLMEPRRFWRQFRFCLQFSIFALMTCFDRPDCTAAVRDFFRAKYRPLLDLLREARSGLNPAQLAKRTVQQFLFARFDSFGVEQWEKFIVAMEESGNDRFFAADDAGRQHELLRTFLPFVIDLHNGDWERLSLQADTPFRALILQMLDSRPASIVGYNAVLCLPSVLLRAEWRMTAALVRELLERRTPAAIYFANLLLANLSYSDPKMAEPALTLVRDEILPKLLEENLACDWSTMFCIAALDSERLWPLFESILHRLLDHFDARRNAAETATLGDALYKVCFCHDIAFGRRLIELLLRRRDRFLEPSWRKCTLRVFAAMLARSPQTLRAAMAAEGVDEALLREAREYLSEDILRQSRLFPFQVDINRFLAWLYLAEPRLRQPVIKYFIGSLALGDSVRDFAAGVRQTLLAFLDVFLGDDPENAPAGRLEPGEIADAVAAARRGRRA